MAFNFEFRNMEVIRAIKREKFPLLRFAGIIKNIFLALIIFG